MLVSRSIRRIPVLSIPKNELFYVKGLISVRGNSAGIVYANFNPLLVKLLMRKPVNEIFDCIHQMCIRVCRREYPLEDYIFRQKLGADYKSSSHEMAVFTDRLKHVGRNHKAGEELEYVMVRTYGDCLKGYKMQAPDLFEENGNILDTVHYITHNLAKPIEQLLTCIYKDDVLKNYEKRKIRPKKPTAAQTVTDEWHLELYIQRYVAGIHQDWFETMNHLKCIAYVAEQTGKLNYVIDTDRVVQLMKLRYGIDWVPTYDQVRSRATEKKQPIHRHEVWKNIPAYQTPFRP